MSKTTYDVKGNVRMVERRKSDAEQKTASIPPSADAVVVKDTKSTKARKHAKHVEESDSSSDSDTDECYEPLGLEAWRYPMYSPSASYRQVDVVSGSHQYTISGFPLARSMGCGTRLCSDFFEVCGQLFRLEVYPGGFTADACRYVSVFLTTPGSLNPNHIMYELAILDQSGKERHIIEKRDASSQRCPPHLGGGGFGGGGCHMHGPMLSHSRGIVAALPKFIKAGFLVKHSRRYMPCDMLVLRATVQVLRGWSSSPMVHSHLGYDQQGAATTLPALGLGYGMMPGATTAMQSMMQHQQRLLYPMPGPYPMVAGGARLYAPPQYHHAPQLPQGLAAPQYMQPQAYQPAPYGMVLQPPPLQQQPAAAMLYAPVRELQPSQLLPAPQPPQQQWSGSNQASGPVGGYYISGADAGQQQHIPGPSSGHEGVAAAHQPQYLVYMSSPSLDHEQ